MTGPEHYAEAERLLTAVGDALRDADSESSPAVRQARLAATSVAITGIVTAAQVHATLAHAAATSESLSRPDTVKAWADAGAFPWPK